MAIKQGKNYFVTNQKGEFLEADNTSNEIVGGKGPDKLYGLGGHDSIFGEGGNDQIFGDSGNDKLYGGAGNDTIYGGTGADVINGDAGHDVLGGGAGNDTISGGTGNDTIYGGDGNDKIDGGAGKDKIYGGNGDDEITAGKDDIVFGGNGNDIIWGTDADQLGGGAVNDTIIGSGDIYGGAGDDAIYGNGDSSIYTGTNTGKGFDYVKAEDGKFDIHAQGRVLIDLENDAIAIVGFKNIEGHSHINGFDANDKVGFQVNATDKVSVTANDAENIITIGFNVSADGSYETSVTIQATDNSLDGTPEGVMTFDELVNQVSYIDPAPFF